MNLLLLGYVLDTACSHALYTDVAHLHQQHRLAGACKVKLGNAQNGKSNEFNGTVVTLLLVLHAACSSDSLWMVCGNGQMISLSCGTRRATTLTCLRCMSLCQRTWRASPALSPHPRPLQGTLHACALYLATSGTQTGKTSNSFSTPVPGCQHAPANDCRL